MRLLRKIILQIALMIFLSTGAKTYANPTPVLNSLTPSLQKIMRLYGEHQRFDFSDNDTVDDYAEYVLNRYHITIDGNLYKGHGGPMKLTNEDIESLYNLPCVKQLDLKRFDLTDVDINKFLEINKNRTMEFLDLNDCSFDTFDDEKVVTRITNKEYTVGIHPSIWIAWPGVNPDEIFEGR